jgi:hypothetical protein
MLADLGDPAAAAARAKLSTPTHLDRRPPGTDWVAGV